MKNLWYYKPFFLLFILFLADKVLLIPAVSQRFTVMMPFDGSLLSMEGLTRLNEQGVRHVWVFGTSTSGPMQFVPYKPEDVSKVNFLSTEERRFLESQRLHTFWGVGATPSASLHRYLYLREQGYKPDLVLLELSWVGLNVGNQGRNAYNLQFSPDTLILRNLGKYDRGFLLEWAKYKAFIGSAFPLTFAEEKSSRDLLRSLDLEDQMFNIDLSEQGQYVPVHSTDRPADAFPDPATAPGYLSLLEFYLSYSPGSFQLDPVATGQYEALIDTLLKEGVPVIVWIPRMHRNVWYLLRRDGIEASINSYRDSLKRKYPGLIFVDFGDEKMFQCNYYRDEMHLAGGCYPELVARILKQAPTPALSDR